MSISGYRNLDTLRERGNQNDRFKSGQIFEFHLFSRKERFKPEVSRQSEKLEPAYPQRTFQNGGIISFKRALERGRFSMQGGLERSILRCSIARRITEFCMFRVERQTLSICLPLFRLGSGPSSFHKVDENSCHKEVEWEDYNLSRRHLDNGRVQGRFIDNKRYSHSSAPELGLCHQLQEVCVRPMPYVGISGIGNRFSEYEHGTSQGESRKDQETMSISTLIRKNLSDSVRDLARLTGRLSSTEMAVLPALLRYRGFQQQQITGLSVRGSYEDTIV